MNQETLYAYLDGELTAEEVTRVETALARDPDLQAELSAMRGVDAALASLPGHDAPDSFVDRVVQAAGARRSGLLLRFAAPLAAAAALAVAVILPGNDPVGTNGDPFTTQEHINYVWEADAETFGSLSMDALEGQILMELEST